MHGDRPIRDRGQFWGLGARPDAVQQRARRQRFGFASSITWASWLEIWQRNLSKGLATAAAHRAERRRRDAAGDRAPEATVGEGLLGLGKKRASVERD